MSNQLVAAAEANMSVIILITGFVVVFAVLLLLIGIIKLYSVIVYNAQNRAKTPKKSKESADTAPATPVSEPIPAPVQTVSDGSLDLQTVAVITAAVEAFYSDNKKVRITGIRRATGARSEWATAGVRESIAPMRSEGLL